MFSRFFKKHFDTLYDEMYFINCNETDPDTIRLLYDLQQRLKRGLDVSNSIVMCSMTPLETGGYKHVNEIIIDSENKSKIDNFFIFNRPFNDCTNITNKLPSGNKSFRMIFIKNPKNVTVESLVDKIISRKNTIETSDYKIQRQFMGKVY